MSLPNCGTVVVGVKWACPTADGLAQLRMVLPDCGTVVVGVSWAKSRGI